MVDGVNQSMTSSCQHVGQSKTVVWSGPTTMPIVEIIIRSKFDLTTVKNNNVLNSRGVAVSTAIIIIMMLMRRELFHFFFFLWFFETGGIVKNNRQKIIEGVCNKMVWILCILVNIVFY